MADGSPSPDTGERWLIGHQTPGSRCVEVMTVAEHEAVLQASLDREAALERLMVEAVIPLEVIAGQHVYNPYTELSEDLIDSVMEAIGDIRAALASTSREPTEGSESA